MKISDLFHPEHVISELKGITSFEVIDEMVAHLVRCGKMTSSLHEPATTVLKNRERSMSTGVGFGIALPHAYSDLFNEPVVMVGRSRVGIDFSALDHQPVKVVMLVIAPEHDRVRHLWILSTGARLLHHRNIRDAIERATDPESIVEILINGAALLVETQKRMKNDSTL